MTERTVKTSLIAQADQYIAEFEKAAAKTRQLSGEQETLAAKARSFELVGRTAFTVGATAAAGMALAVAKSADFDAAMSNVSAATMETSENMALLRQAALDFGESSVFNATQSAGAIEELGKAGLSTADILSGGLGSALNLASAGGLEIGRAAEIAATTMSQFGIAGADAARVADVLAAGAGKALGSVDDLANGLKFVGPVAAQMGVSLEETTGVLALFAQQGIIGEQAGTSLRGMLSSLTSPSKLAKAEIEKLGITLYDSQGQFLGLENAAGQLSTAYQGMTDAQRDASLGVLFGNEQITAARVLYAAGAEGVRQWTQDVSESGYAAEVAARRLDNLKGDLEEFGGAVETAMIGIGSSGDGALRVLVQSATDAVGAFNDLDPAAQVVAGSIGSVVAAAGLTAGAFFTAVPKIAEYKVALSELGPNAERAGRAVGALSKGLGAIAIAGAAVQVLDTLAQQGEPAAASIEKITSALLARDFDEGFEGISRDVQDLDTALTALFANDWETAFDRFGQEVFAFTGLSSEVAQSKEAFDGVGQSLAKLVAIGEGDRAAALFDELAEKAEKQGVSVEQLRKLMPAYADALAEVDNQQVIAAQSAEGNAAALDTMTNAAGQTQESIDALAESVRGFGQDTIDAIGADSAFYQAVDDAAEAFGADGFARTLDLTTQAGRDNTDMLLGIAQAANDAAAAAYEQSGSVENLNAKLDEGRQALFDQARQFFDTDEAAWAYIDTLVQTPEEITTQVKLTGVANAEAQLQALVTNWQNRQITVKFFADTYNLDRSAAAAAARYTGMALRYAQGPSSANGNMFSYSSGGFGEGIFSGGTPLYKFAEPETRWEAFVSGRPGAEARNRQIVAEAASRLGMPSPAGPTSVSLEGARIVLDVDGRQITGLVREQVLRHEREMVAEQRMGWRE